MRVNNLLVEEVLLTDNLEGARLGATLYEFAGPKWVSVNQENTGRVIGPVTLLEEFSDAESLQEVSVLRFPQQEKNLKDGLARAV